MEEMQGELVKCPPLGDLLLQSSVCLVSTFRKVLKKKKESKFFFPLLLDNKEKDGDLNGFFSQRTPEWKMENHHAGK